MHIKEGRRQAQGTKSVELSQKGSHADQPGQRVESWQRGRVAYG